ncbi:MAG: methylene-tetrahydromethanopterin dehydrogenase N-terminal domain-containing protein [Candidatus Atabeyarchaeum deiterrae]
MKVLEIEPLKDVDLRVMMIEKEFNEPFLAAALSPGAATKLLARPSMAFSKFMEELIRRSKPTFATEELGDRSQKDFYESNPLAPVFKKNNVPFFPADIDENAKSYLLANISQKIELRTKVLDELSTISRQKGSRDRSALEKEDYLVTYGQCLQSEIEDELKQINFATRQNWIAMGILDSAKKVNGKKSTSMTCYHIASPEHVEGVKKLLEALKVKVEVLSVSKKAVPVQAEVALSGSSKVESVLQSYKIQVKPVIKKASEYLPYLLFFLDCDNKKVNPFDICMGYDAGYDSVIPYNDIQPEEAKVIIQDALLSRGPAGAKRTCFLIGGKDSDKAEKVLEVALQAMFPPFEAPVIIDPSGAYTTAAAMVAKVESALVANSLGDIRKKSCVIFGTGPVGKVAAVLLSRLGSEVTIVSPNPGRADGDVYIKGIATRLYEKYGVNVEGFFAPTREKRMEIAGNKDLIFTGAQAGTQLIDMQMMNELEPVKVFADINAIPPLGIEGLKPEDEMREIVGGMYGVGPITIGKLKHKIEVEILKGAKESGKGVFDYNFALDTARRLLQKKSTIPDFTVTLTYPESKIA